ncbi:IclR family transcriptional regulator [Nocardioides sp. YJ-D4]
MVESVHKALILLNSIRDQGELRLKDAAAEIGVAESTAHRMLATLIFHGFVVQDASRRYRAGPSIGVPPAEARWARGFRDACRQEMRELADATGETVNIVVRTGTLARVMASEESTRPLRAGSRQGHVPPARAAVGGKVLLAELDTSELEDLYLSDRARQDDRMTSEEFRQFLRSMRAIRELGYATAVDEVEIGLSAVAVCLRNESGTAVGALVVAMPTMRLRDNLDQRLVVKMRVAASRIEPLIGELIPE